MAVETAERFADNEVSIDELEAVWERSATQDDGGGAQVPRELDSDAAAAAAYTASPNDQAAAVDGSIHAACAVGRCRGNPWNDGTVWDSDAATELAAQTNLLRDIFGNPFRPVAFIPAWCSETAVTLASGIYAERAFDRLPILADALEDAGCDNLDVLTHCRGPGPHVRGCWVVDLVLGKG